MLSKRSFWNSRSAACLVGIAYLCLNAFWLPKRADASDLLPRRVLIIHSFGKNFLPWSEYATAIRAELARQSPSALSIEDYPLITAASLDRGPEVPFVDYLRSLYSRSLPDLVVTIGAPAASFVQRHRAALFATTPALFAAVDQRFINQTALTEYDTAVAVTIELAPLFQNILRLLPATKQIAVMLGNSPPEVLWLEAMKKELATFEDGVAINYYHQRSFDDMLKLAAVLPAHSAIFWNQLRVDGAGVTHEGDESLKRMRAVANAPIFSYDDTFLTGETVGGPMLSRTEISGKTAAVAVRLLAGEKPVAIRPGPIGFAPPRYDWRELQRWNISESSLPEGSEVYFRETTVWQQYRVQILALSTVFLMQGWLIAALLYERRGRRYADGELRQRMSELARINRYSTAGELSSSIAHEINQPLATILANAETATLMLQQAPPNLDEIRHILLDIQRDNHRASDIVRHLRNLFKGGSFEAKVIDLNEVINEVLEIASATAERHRVQIQSVFEAPRIQVEGDAVQLQQVVMNLLVNAIDAVMQEHGPRTVVVRVGQVTGRAQLSVIDTGPGVPPERREDIFEPLFTTKNGGMGMGLAIVRTIVRAHGGQIWVDDAVGGGAVFLVTLPLAPIAHA